MAARNPARWLAPVALAATIAGGYLIVHHNLADTTHSSTNASSTQTSSSSHHKHHKDRHAKYAKVTYYTVKPGENLTEIANLTGVSLTQIEALNPSLRQNPQSLQSGERIRLRK